MIKAVLFDIDGVLLDSFDAGFKWLQDLVVQMGYPKPTKRAYGQAFHLLLPYALKHLAKAELTEELERIHEIIEKVPYPSEMLSEPPQLRTLAVLHTNTSSVSLPAGTRRTLKRYFPFAQTKNILCLYHR